MYNLWVNSYELWYITYILIFFLPLLVEEHFPAHQEEFLSLKLLHCIINTTVTALTQYLTNHVFVLAQQLDVSSLSSPMPGPQQTMWELHSSSTPQTSQYDTSWDRSDSFLQWSSVLVVWSQGGAPGVSSQWLHPVRYQGHILQGLGTEKTVICEWVLVSVLTIGKYLPTVRLAHCEVSLPAELETTHR